MTLAKKRKLDNHYVNKELDFEKKPRSTSRNGQSEDQGKNTKCRHLLPIKVSSGRLLSQTLKIEEIENKTTDLEQTVQSEVVLQTKVPPKMIIFEQRKRQINLIKHKIAKLASTILTNPQSNISALKQLRLMLEDDSTPESFVTTKKLVIASITCLFIDIIPGYRIRERTDKEKEVKLSKEVKILTSFEEGLLHQYKLFLQFLEKAIFSRKRPGRSKLMSVESEQSIGQIAIEAMCDLYEKTSHFNFHNNIAVVIVPIANDDYDPAVRSRCCNAIVSIFSTDKIGASTLATIKAISKISKERGPKKIKVEFLNTLLRLRINKVDYSMVAHTKTKAERKRAKEEKKKLSRREVKYMKKQKSIDNELKEAAASEDQEKRTQLNTETLQHVFLIYFRILKHKSGAMLDCRSVLPSVLEGLAKFSHLINVDFFGDLLLHLQRLVESGELSLRENLHCVFTAFQILSGQGEVLNVDPAKFYSVMFGLLHEIPFYLPPHKAKTSENNVEVVINCIEMMLNKRRKQVTMTTLKSFIKRLATITLQMQPSRFPLCLIEEMRSLLNTNSKSASLFDTESSEIGSYSAAVDDPEQNGSNSAVLWEFHALSRHYVPVVSQSAVRLLKEFAT